MGKSAFPIHLGTSSTHWVLSMFSQISVQLFTYILHAPMDILKTFFLNHFSVLVNSTISCNRELHGNRELFQSHFGVFHFFPCIIFEAAWRKQTKYWNLVEEAKTASILSHNGKHLVVKNLKEILIMACTTLWKKRVVWSQWKVLSKLRCVWMHWSSPAHVSVVIRSLSLHSYTVKSSKLILQQCRVNIIYSKKKKKRSSLMSVNVSPNPVFTGQLLFKQKRFQTSSVFWRTAKLFYNGRVILNL